MVRVYAVAFEQGVAPLWNFFVIKAMASRKLDTAKR